MIIKSLSRKSRIGGKNPFRALLRYMNRGIEKEDGEAVLWQNFYGSEASREADILAEFEANAAVLPERKNGNVLYHEILSFSEGHTIKDRDLVRAITDIGQEYLRLRAPEQLAYGVVHKETGHIHLHLMISANTALSPERVRLSRKEFAEAQKGAERYALARYPELKQTVIYDYDVPERARRQGERVKREANEQAMQAKAMRKGERVSLRKDALKGQLHGLFEQAKDARDLENLLEKAGYRVYVRGKNVGVIVREPDGSERKHRFSTLGVHLHFEATKARFADRGLEGEPKEHASDLVKAEEKGMTGKYFDQNKPLLGEDEVKEFVTGKLAPRNHGPIAPDPFETMPVPQTEFERQEALARDRAKRRKERGSQDKDRDNER